MSAQLSFHHVTAVSSDAAKTIDFYTTSLGLRLLRKTVNYDDTSLLEIHCGDVGGAPGTVIAFIVDPGLKPGVPGTGQVSNLVFSVRAGSLVYWLKRLEAQNASITGWATAFGERYLCFTDPDGLPLALVEDDDGGLASENSPATIGRLRSAELHLHGYEHTARFLIDVLGFVHSARDGAVSRFRRHTNSDVNILDLLSAPDFRRGTDGSGVTHRIAWRVGGLAELEAFRRLIVEHGMDATPVLDRNYFHAVYFDAPGGVRFGLVTDTPGFGLDDQPADGRVALPPWLEAKRPKIETRLRHLSHDAVGH